MRVLFFLFVFFSPFIEAFDFKPGSYLMILKLNKKTDISNCHTEQAQTLYTQFSESRNGFIKDRNSNYVLFERTSDVGQELGSTNILFFKSLYDCLLFKMDNKVKLLK